ncbi:formate/nitrite transporter family protein [Pectobacterium aroidearum]|jgi:formate/nitrite transporter FocA (FNT family)|uniref:formate/nitrite transporter family protein n=1 Tax=Pectobacterium aroidearum TaxID=1201031 RepID=UPI0015EFF5D3|nr:formate/nitrite transporter family protein [Pectobacterium aroidearum]MBA5236935.1 formate/nitrite transporter family protein [Pectobacterium aroidearum]UUE37677.1 formate/nitrite transporter family protein [Pectobacterium aroidearum]UUE42053.1 formate/nitrite transporter family protein [Pectobacterium aroidearum]UUE46371.1 formate/nitrite transporter family protein [Pectobacterium aroidearum]UUE50592.1 formate/nitrite transporter family protein [Pectobacterium aroidearum]
MNSSSKSRQTQPEQEKDVAVESDESTQGKAINVDEDRLPSPAAAIHEEIRQEGQKELERDAMALLWSAIAAGISMGTSFMAVGMLHNHLVGVPGGFLLECFGYTIGFVIVIMARQQLFTENTVTAVLPIMHKPTRGNVYLLGRLWFVVLVGNLIGTALAALAFTYMPVFDGETREALVDIAMKVMKNSPTEMFANAVVSGWIIATMVWMLPRAYSAKLWIIIIMTWMIAFSNLTHIVAGASEIFYLVFIGHISWQAFIWPFALPTLAGNIIGGTFIFALISHAQIRNDMSNPYRGKPQKRRENEEK